MMIIVVGKLMITAVVTILIEIVSVYAGAPMPCALAAIVALVLVFSGFLLIDFDDYDGI